MNRPLTAVVPALMAVVATTTPAVADTWHVPGDFATIQAAIDAAANGDEIVVADGTYTGPGNHDMDFDGRAITVRSENGAAACIIDLHDEEGAPQRAFHFHSGETALSVVQGFTITNGVMDAGGAMLIENGSAPTIMSCAFEGNAAITVDEFAGGGAVAVYGSQPTFSGCTFSGNSVVNSPLGTPVGTGGGAMFIHSASLTITDSTFTGNTSEIGGGALIGWLKSQIEVSGCVFEGNLAERGGGGVYLEQSGTHATFTDCQFIENTSGQFWGGGGARIGFEATADLVDCEFLDNMSLPGAGGGAHILVNAQVTFTKTLFAGNQSVGLDNGGALSLWTAYAEVIDSRFLANSADQGGAIWNYGSSPLIMGCLFAGNVATDFEGGAMLNETYQGVGSSPTIVNCTVVHNDSPAAPNGQAGGICGFGVGSDALIVNSIVYGNEAFLPDGEQLIDLAGALTTVLSSDVEDGWINMGGAEGGDGNIDADPMFVDPDGPDDDPETFDDNDYRLAAGSPCIDTADNGALPPGASLDLDGNPRVVNCNVDMGAYEFQDTITINGDVNCDGTVNVIDLLVLIAAWGPCDAYRPEDINGDGTVDTIDLLTLLGNWS